MGMRLAGVLVLTLCAAAVGVRAQMATIPLWAYGYIAYPATPGDYTAKCQGERADPCALHPRGRFPRRPPADARRRRARQGSQRRARLRHLSPAERQGADAER